MEISDRLATDIKARFGHRPAMGAQHYLEQWIAVTGLTQQEVGDKAGYEKTHFNKIVTGKNRLSRDKARNISEALTEILGYRVHPNDLFRQPPIPLRHVDAGRMTSDNGVPAGKEVEMLELARPIIVHLVRTLGLETVVKEAAEAANHLKESEQPHPMRGRKM